MKMSIQINNMIALNKREKKDPSFADEETKALDN